jgi:hypothetical protein
LHCKRKGGSISEGQPESSGRRQVDFHGRGEARKAVAIGGKQPIMKRHIRQGYKAVGRFGSKIVEDMPKQEGQLLLEAG